MKTLKNKIAAITISICFILSMTASMTLMPSASAHTPPWTITDHAYVVAEPSPIGVGQTMVISFWTAQPMINSLLQNNIRKGPYTLVITNPNGINTTETWAYASNSGGEDSYTYVPTIVGNYTVTFIYGGQAYPALSQVVSSIPLTAAQITSINLYAGDTYSPATAVTTFTVQQQPLVATTYPLPTAYWTRPIEGENYNWYAVASNWLGGANGGFGGDTLEATSGESGYNIYQPYGSAPTSAHILWTQPEEFGGVVGATDTVMLGATFYSGDSYEPRFTGAIVMDGYLYFKEPLSDAGGTTVVNGVTYAGDYVCLDLSTGAIVWKNTNPIFDPTWGELMDIVNPNQSGVTGGYLWQSVSVPAVAVNGVTIHASYTTWEAFDAYTGNWLFNITNIPASSTTYGPNSYDGGSMLSETTTKDAMGPSGELLIYVMHYNTQTKSGWLALWNTTSLIENTYISMSEWRPIGQVYNGSSGSVYQGNIITPYNWNVTINADLDGLVFNGTSETGVSLTGPTINAVVPGDMMAGASSGLTIGPGSQYTPNPFTMWAINLNPSTGQIGQALWVKNYTAPDVMATNPNLGSYTERFGVLDPTTDVIVNQIAETMELVGYSATTGNQLWGPTTTVFPDQYQFFGGGMGSGQCFVDAYGKVYVQGYGGEIWCYNTTNGNLLWTFGDGGAGNSTNDGINSPWGLLPTLICAVANGEVFVGSQQHGNGALSPYYKGESIWVLNATTGKQIWTILFQVPNDGGPGSPEGVIADGQFVEYNFYDNQVYDFGQGPSKTTVNAPDIGVTTATPITITGTVMDVSAGTQQTEQKADFPNGVPCVSDASEGQWMEYVYMQKPEPTNATGVQVTLSVTDVNHNTYNIGTTTTNALGDYGFVWTPPIPGNYTVYATFAGSNAYYGSSASTYIYASSPPAAAPVPTATPTSVANTYFVPAIAGLSILIIVVAIVLALLTLSRKRP